VLKAALAAGSIGGRRNGREVAMKVARLFVVFLVFPLMMLAVASRAHGVEGRDCHDRSIMIDNLIAQYGEQLAEVREVEGKGLLEFHVSPEDGTWTALITKNNGVSCVLGVGDGIDPSKTKTLKVGLPI